eukprot:2725562-Rhodomonas_salina.1
MDRLCYRCRTVRGAVCSHDHDVMVHGSGFRATSDTKAELAALRHQADSGASRCGSQRTRLTHTTAPRQTPARAQRGTRSQASAEVIHRENKYKKPQSQYKLH